MGSQVPKRLRASSYFFLAGLIPGKIGAWAWTLWGAASLGVEWERCSGCDISAFDPHLLSASFSASHYPFLILGLWRLHK